MLRRPHGPITGSGSTADVEGLVAPQADRLKGSILSSRPTVRMEKYPVPSLQPAKEHLGGIQTIKVPVLGQAGPGQSYHGGEDVQHT